MIGRVVGAALGGAIGKQNNGNPLIGAAVGAVTLMAARRLLPARIAGLGAAVAAGYLTRKFAQRAERRAATMAAVAAAPLPVAPLAAGPLPVVNHLSDNVTPAQPSMRKTRGPRHPEST
jgi:hypothetical protein